ncbi:MAG: hypothetical protein ACFFBD_19610 [Candidatus Hodarchaeota archaeon]
MNFLVTLLIPSLVCINICINKLLVMNLLKPKQMPMPNAVHVYALSYLASTTKQR